MKIMFKRIAHGWRNCDTYQRSINTHEPGPYPPFATMNGWRFNKESTTNPWSENGWAFGIISDLPSDSRYSWEVAVHSDPTELKGWLRAYVKANPEESLPLLAEVLQLAVDARKQDDG